MWNNTRVNIPKWIFTLRWHLKQKIELNRTKLLLQRLKVAFLRSKIPWNTILIQLSKAPAWGLAHGFTKPRLGQKLPQAKVHGLAFHGLAWLSLAQPGAFRLSRHITNRIFCKRSMHCEISHCIQFTGTQPQILVPICVYFKTILSCKNESS